MSSKGLCNYCRERGHKISDCDERNKKQNNEGSSRGVPSIRRLVMMTQNVTYRLKKNESTTDDKGYIDFSYHGIEHGLLCHLGYSVRK